MRKILEANTIQNPELKKYITCWENDEYRQVAPGELLVPKFLEWARPNRHMTIIDWGCGTGRAAKRFYAAPYDFDVTAVDFAYNCLDPEVKEFVKDNDRFRFVEEDLAVQSNLRSEYGFCTDVMEHIPEEQIDAVLTNILYASKHVFFQISTVEDIFSKHIDVDGDLHVSVFDYQWWLKKFTEHSVIIHRSEQLHGAVIFYLTGWSERALNWNGGHLNTDEEKIKENIAENAKLGLQPIVPHVGDGEVEVMLLCGGPTLNDFEDEIREKRANDVKCVTVNGSYNWCLERSIKPSMQCMVDARKFNKRFVEQIPGLTDKTKYAISSQCDPSIFDDLPKDRTYMWQTTTSAAAIPYIKEHYGEMYKDWFPSPGGSTVGLRALMLLRMLGFDKIYIYGMDSCVFEDRDHHAYEQKENDHLNERKTVPIVVGKGTAYEKRFQCQPWQAYQSREFELMVPSLEQSGVHLQVKGDGLIAYMIEAAAKHVEDTEVDDQNGFGVARVVIEGETVDADFDHARYYPKE